MITFILVLHLFMVILSIYLMRIFGSSDGSDNIDDVIVDIVFKICDIVYIVEGLLKIMFAFTRRRYVNKYLFNIRFFFQFPALISSLIDFCYWNLEKEVFFKIIRLIFIFRLFVQFRKIRKASKLVVRTMIPLSKICSAFIIVLAVYSIIGVSLFGNAIHNRCRTTSEPINGEWELAMSSQDQLCGFKECEVGQTCGNPYDFGITSKNSEIGNSRDLFYGELTFTHFLNSFMTNLVIVGGEDWSGLLYMVLILLIQYWDKVNPGVSALYFMILILMTTFLMVQLIIASILKVFYNFSSIRKGKYLSYF